MPIALRAALVLALLALAAPAPALNGYVGCSTGDDAYPFDLDSYAVGGRIDLLPEGDYPYDATCHPDGDALWICGAAGDGVVVIDRATGAVLQRMGTGGYPVSVAFSADRALALVSCRDGERIDVFDADSYALLRSLPIPGDYLGPGNLALDPVSGNFYLVEWYDDVLYEIAPDGGAILRQVSLGTSLWQLVVAPDGGAIYVTDRGGDLVRVVDPATLSQVAAVGVGDDPWGVDITADGAALCVACEDSHQLWFIDTEGLAARPLLLAADADPRDVDILDAAGRAFVPSGQIAGADGVYAVDLATETVAALIAVPGGNANVVAVAPQMAGDLSAAGVSPAAAPALRVHPNPFNPAARLSFRLPAAGPVHLDILDATGRRLRRLDAGPLAAGEHALSWDGRDDAGRELASGLYLIRLYGPGRTAVARAVLLR